MTREEAYEQAAVSYRRAGYDLHAARCYRNAGAHRRAAEIYEAAGEHAHAAASFADAGLPELGAWLLVQHAGLPAEARAMLDPPPGREAGAAPAPGARASVPVLRYGLIIARCEIAEGASADVIRPVIAEVCASLADRSLRSDQVAEEWAVALCLAAARYDQAALVFAAAVRGGRYGAEQRWQAWSARVLGAELIIPPVPTPPPAAATTVT